MTVTDARKIGEACTLYVRTGLAGKLFGEDSDNRLQYIQACAALERENSQLRARLTRAAGESRRVDPGAPLQTGSGRTIFCPALKGTPAQRMRQIEAWMVSEAMLEAQSRGDAFVEESFRAAQKNVARKQPLTPSDVDGLNDYLWTPSVVWDLSTLRTWMEGE